jgi:hypothetical protein
MLEQAEDEWTPANVLRLERLTALPPEAAAWGRPLDERARDEKFITDHYDELEEVFPGEWVAVFEEQVVDHDRRFPPLWRRLRKAGLAVQSPATFFFELCD